MLRSLEENSGTLMPHLGQKMVMQVALLVAGVVEAGVEAEEGSEEAESLLEHPRAYLAR